MGEYISDVDTITGGHSINLDVGNWAREGRWNQIIKRQGNVFKTKEKGKNWNPIKIIPKASFILTVLKMFWRKDPRLEIGATLQFADYY